MHAKSAEASMIRSAAREKRGYRGWVSERCIQAVNADGWGCARTDGSRIQQTTCASLARAARGVFAREARLLTFSKWRSQHMRSLWLASFPHCQF